jgi:exopolysaccharide biosynthesis protein
LVYAALIIPGGLYIMTRHALRRLGLLLLASLACLLPLRVAPQPSALAAPQADGWSQSSTPIGPGVQLTTFWQGTARGPVEGEFLTVDITNPKLSVKLLGAGPLAAAQPVSQMVANSGAIAGVNGDFFDIYHTSAPYGIAVSDGQVLKGPIWNWNQAAGIGQDGVGRIADVNVNGTVRLPGGEVPLNGLNQHNISAGCIGVYTTVWGPASRGRAVEGAQGVFEVTVQNGVVVGKAPFAGSGWIPPDAMVLLGREGGAQTLSALNIGDPVSVAYWPWTNAPAPFQMAVGGKTVLVRDGQIQDMQDNKTDPRSAIGFSADGHTLFLMTVNGRQRGSRGLTLRELAVLMQQIGAFNAMNLDGGGSSTMLARKPGDAGAEVVNHPSNGFERPVPNAIGIIAAPGSGQLHGLRVLPAVRETANQVFPGLSRTLIAKGFDENYGPAPIEKLGWESTTPANGTFEPGGVFRGGQPGTAWVLAHGDGPAGRKQSDDYPVMVLGYLARIATTSAGMTLNAGSPPAYFGVTGYAGDGQATSIETRDVSLNYDQSIVDITPVSPDVFQVTPRVEHGSTTVALSVGGYTTVFPIFIGLQSVVAAEFEDLNGWSYVGGNAEGAIGHGPGQSGQGLQMQYNFAQSTDPRTATARIDPPLALPGEVLTVGAWVHGSGQGEHLVFNLQAADGTALDLEGPRITWNDWQYIEVNLPAGVNYPVHLVGMTAREADPTRQYSGQVIFDGLGVKTIQR